MSQPPSIPITRPKAQLIANAEEMSSFRDQLLGSWTLVSYTAHAPTNPADKVHPMGPNATGIIMYTPDGYMSAQLQTPGTPSSTLRVQTPSGRRSDGGISLTPAAFGWTRRAMREVPYSCMRCGIRICRPWWGIGRGGCVRLGRRGMGGTYI